ncbi:hypothetical protein Pfo_005678 [Paulownia fortunei]|nr:hypothetical protein Pfo_005678 [Paulownia fortunei]
MAKLTNSLSFLKNFYGPDRLPAAAVFDLGSQSSPYCAICLNDIRGGDSYRKLPECGHCFHAQCIDAWFQSHSTCPLCRIQVPQIISLNESHCQWGALISNIVLLLQSFLEKMCNPLNDELTSMLCDNIRCIS